MALAESTTDELCTNLPAQLSLGPLGWVERGTPGMQTLQKQGTHKGQGNWEQLP